ncbi:hypothetical protein [Paenibacillus cremeus]|uniref:Uncharacterized protein n=1 Tax=Paenibacillus cremeus TaxID=2163881 RepID=A0A559K5S4_9BACL|nr:hypothetical protein [Paenibacillus cremeus]TVY07495.1 hypothetical protein FPZ49_23715 [Paenibacillus cremeus]
MIRLGVNPEQLLDARTDEWRAMPDIRIKPIPAAHELLDYDPARRHRFIGYLLELNGVKLYHA